MLWCHYIRKHWLVNCILWFRRAWFVLMRADRRCSFPRRVCSETRAVHPKSHILDLDLISFHFWDWEILSIVLEWILDSVSLGLSVNEGFALEFNAGSTLSTVKPTPLPISTSSENYWWIYLGHSNKNAHVENLGPFNLKDKPIRMHVYLWPKRDQPRNGIVSKRIKPAIVWCRSVCYAMLLTTNQNEQRLEEITKLTWTPPHSF